jgi:hypothetical protein
MSQTHTFTARVSLFVALILEKRGLCFWTREVTGREFSGNPVQWIAQPLFMTKNPVL